MIQKLKSLYQDQQFNPGWLGIFLNPFYFCRTGLYAAIAGLAPMLSGRLLDVGCGTKPYRALFNVSEYVGLDIDSARSRQRGVADCFYEGNVFPFPDESFDSIICSQVLEHVFNPDEFLSEIARVLKVNGEIIITVPFVWDEHLQPFDYARYSSFGLRALLERQGFRVCIHRKLGADASVLFQLANAYLYKIVQGIPVPLRLLLMMTVMAGINLGGLLAKLILPRNEDLYLDQVVLAEKVR